jgi:hypothetical protein
MTERFGRDRNRQKREPNIWVKLSILRISLTLHIPEQSLWIKSEIAGEVDKDGQCDNDDDEECGHP